MKKNVRYKFNKNYVIDGYKKCCPLKILRRLCDLGLIKGEKLRLVRESLFGKVILIEIGGYTLSIQKKIFDFLNLEEKRGY